MNEKKVQKVLDKIRPYIQRDGGDVTLDHLQDDVAYVRFHGACVGCMSLDSPFYGGIRDLLLEELPPQAARLTHIAAAIVAAIIFFFIWCSP